MGATVNQQSTAELLPVIFNQLKQLGYSQTDICHAAGIELPSNGNDGALSAAQNNTLFNFACFLLAANTSPLQPKTVVTKQATDMLLYAVISCQDLQEVIERSISYCQLVDAIGLTLTLNRLGDRAEFCVDTLSQQMHSQRPLPTGSMPHGFSQQLLILAAMSIFYQLFSWLTGTDIELIELGLREGEFESPLPLGALQGQRVRFQQPANRMVFPAALLSQPVIRDADQLRDVIVYFPMNLINAGGTLAHRVKALINASLGEFKAPISVENIAQLLNLSPSSLRRKLAESNLSYTQLLTQCRLNKAEHALLHTDLPIKTIALQLGFSDDRAFRRAVKSGLGLSPTELRQQALHCATNTQRGL
jgi:AraC-like DNA-binding protein